MPTMVDERGRCDSVDEEMIRFGFRLLLMLYVVDLSMKNEVITLYMNVRT